MSSGRTYKQCVFPEGLLYDVENMVWVKLEGEVASVGATDPGQAYAGEILFIKVKEVGTTLKRGEIAATIESAKYMGPMRTPLSGTITSVNEALKAEPSRINSDPYGTWVFKLRPTNLQAEVGMLADAAAAYERFKKIMDELGIECVRL